MKMLRRAMLLLALLVAAMAASVPAAQAAQLTLEFTDNFSGSVWGCTLTQHGELLCIKIGGPDDGGPNTGGPIGAVYKGTKRPAHLHFGPKWAMNPIPGQWGTDQGARDLERALDDELPEPPEEDPALAASNHPYAPRLPDTVVDGDGSCIVTFSISVNVNNANVTVPVQVAWGDGTTSWHYIQSGQSATVTHQYTSAAGAIVSKFVGFGPAPGGGDPGGGTSGGEEYPLYQHTHVVKATSYYQYQPRVAYTLTRHVMPG